MYPLRVWRIQLSLDKRSFTKDHSNVHEFPKGSVALWVTKRTYELSELTLPTGLLNRC